MLTIKFTQTVQFETQRNVGPVYEAGSVHTLDDDHAQRWLRRNVAVLVAPEAVAEPPVDAPATEPESPAPVRTEPQIPSANADPKAEVVDQLLKVEEPKPEPKPTFTRPSRGNR